MVIDKEQLISLLKEKTGQEREQVQKQLSELIDRIHKAAEQGKKFEVEGFGTFSMQEGNLQFEPSDTLETEINNKYTGMKPIELIGAFKQPEGDEIPDIDEEEDEQQVWAYDDTASVEGESEEEAEPVTESAGEGVYDETEQQDDTGKNDEEPDTSDEDPDKIIEAIFGSSGVESDDDGRLQETPVKTAPEKESSRVGVDEDNSEEESDLIGQLLVAAVIVIALGVGGWLVYDIGLIGGDEPADNSQQVTGQTTQQAGVSARKTGDKQSESQEDVVKTEQNDKTSEPEQGKQVANTGAAQPNTETQQQDTYGLRGDVEQSIDNGYTIVVYSLTDMDRAETQRDNLQQAGYRVLINTVEVGGNKHYRVGIGQFQTVDAAQQAVDDIPESFQSSSNHFIKRIK